MKRRFAILGLVLLAVGALLLFGRQWTSTTEPIPVAEKPPTRQLVEPAADRTEAPPVQAAAPTAPTTPTPESATFRGRVLDAVTRQPVPEFEVRLVQVPRGHIRGNQPQVTQTFHSADGRFAWQPAPTGNWNVTVAAQRYQHFRLDGLSIAAGKTTREIVMPLQHGHTLKGRVFDEVSKDGIGDARIGFRDPSVAWDPMRERHEKSKHDGTFVLDGVPAGDMIVMAVANDHAAREISIQVNDDTPPLEIGLATGGTIAGMVIAPDGTPVKGMLMLAGPGIPGASQLDETGRFSFARRPAGHYRLMVNTAAGSARQELDLAENEVREDIVLKVGDGRSVRGVIKGLRPEQLERTIVAVHSESKFGNLTAQPDELGAYAVKGVSPGQAQVTVDATMSRSTRRTIEVPADRDFVLDIVFPPGVRLSGRVTQGAKLAADRIVWVVSPDGKGETVYQARTGQDGRYEFEGVPSGEYRVSVHEGMVASSRSQATRLSTSICPWSKSAAASSRMAARFRSWARACMS